MLILEIGMLVWGVIALFTGSLRFGQVEADGLWARLGGLILMLPVPIAVGYALYSVQAAPADQRAQFLEDNGLNVLVVEVGAILGCLTMAFGVCVVAQNSGGSRGTYSLWEERDSEIRRTGSGRKRRRKTEEEDAEEDRARHKKKDRELAERLREKSRSRRTAVADDEDEEEPRRRSAVPWVVGGVVGMVFLGATLAVVLVAVRLMRSDEATDSTPIAQISTGTEPVNPGPAPAKDRPAKDGKPPAPPVDPPKPRELDVATAVAQGQAVVPCLCWAEDAKSFYCLHKQGIVQRISLDGFREMKRRTFAQGASWLDRSAEGLVVSVPRAGEIQVLDPDSLEVKKTIPVNGMDRAASAPSLSLAFVAPPPGPRAGAVAVVDLTAGKVVAQYSGQQLRAGLDGPRVSPDGTYLFTGGSEQLFRFRINGTKLVPEQASHRIAQGRQAEMCFSPDGNYVCLPSGGGNYNVHNTPQANYITYVYRTNNFATPAFVLQQGGYPQAVGFDDPAGYVYAQNADHQLRVYRFDGSNVRDHQLKGERSVHQFLVHPDGRRLLILTEDRVLHVKLLYR